MRLNHLTVFLVYVLISATLVYAQESIEVKDLIVKANKALSDHRQIVKTSQSIQTFFSDPKNKALINSNSEEIIALIRLQSRLVLYIRLEKELGDWKCNLDSTMKSVKGQEILESILNSTRQCSELGAGFLQEHKKITTLINEMEMIEERGYVGAYSVNEEGDIQFPSGLTKEEQEKVVWKFILPDAGSPTAPFDPYSVDSSRQLNDELYEQSLKDTFKTYIYLQTAYGNEKTNPQKIAKSFCNEKRSFFSRLTGKKKDVHCPKAVEKFVIKTAMNSNLSKHPTSYEDGAKDLNMQVIELNKIIERIQKNTAVEYTYDGKTGDKYVKTATFKNKQQALQDYSEYKKLHTKMVSSGVGLFVATDELNEKLGLKPLNPKNFLAPHSLISKSIFKKAVDEAREHSFEHGQELLSIYHSKKSTENKITEFLKLNPAAASQVLLKRPDLAKTVCRGLHGLSVSENNDHQFRLIATWGGTIVGGAVAFTGVGAIPMAIVGAVAATPDLAMSYKHFEEASNERDAAFAERNSVKATLKTDKYQIAVNELIFSGALIAAGGTADAIQGLRAGKAGTELIEAVDNLAKAERKPINILDFIEERNAQAAAKVQNVLKENSKDKLIELENAWKNGPRYEDVTLSQDELFKERDIALEKGEITFEKWKSLASEWHESLEKRSLLKIKVRVEDNFLDLRPAEAELHSLNKSFDNAYTNQDINLLLKSNTDGLVKKITEFNTLEKKWQQIGERITNSSNELENFENSMKGKNITETDKEMLIEMKEQVRKAKIEYEVTLEKYYKARAVDTKLRDQYSVMKGSN